MSLPAKYLQMLSTVSAEGELRMELVEKDMPTPKPGQIIVRVEATPINPSDHGVMFGWSNMAAASTTGAGKDTVLTAPVPEQGLRVMKARIGQALPVGNEGAGTVVAAGEGDYAQSLLGKVVAVMGGGMYGAYRAVDAMMALPLQDGHTAKDGASSFVKSADSALFPRNHAHGRPQSHRTYRCGLKISARCWSRSARRTGSISSILSAVRSRLIF